MRPDCGNPQYNLSVLVERFWFKLGAGKNKVLNISIDANRAFPRLEVTTRISLTYRCQGDHGKDQEAFHLNVNYGLEVSVT